MHLVLAQVNNYRALENLKLYLLLAVTRYNHHLIIILT